MRNHIENTRKMKRNKRKVIFERNENEFIKIFSIYLLFDFLNNYSKVL